MTEPYLANDRGGRDDVAASATPDAIMLVVSVFFASYNGDVAASGFKIGERELFDYCVVMLLDERIGSAARLEEWLCNFDVRRDLSRRLASRLYNLVRVD